MIKLVFFAAMRQLYVFLILATFLSHGQERLFSRTINSRTYGEFFPEMSLDGNVVLFMSNDTYTGKPILRYSWMEDNRWHSPTEDFPVKSLSSLHYGSYALNADASQLAVSLKSSPSLGGYDIYIIDKIGSGYRYWSVPVNPGKPLNSNKHEGMPSFTPDGGALFFSRCDKMDEENASGCEIYYCVNKGPIWSEPIKVDLDMPPCDKLFPTILIDNETLYFSANPNGDFDLYMTRKDNNGWTRPVALDFINTEADDFNVANTALGNLVVRHKKGDLSTDLFEVLVPDSFQPRKILFLETSVPGAEGKLLIEAYDVVSDQSIYRNIVEGPQELLLFLPESNLIDFSVVSNAATAGFISNTFNLLHLDRPVKQQLELQLPVLEKGKTYATQIEFVPNSAEIAQGSERELERMISLLKLNPSYSLELQIDQGHIRESEKPTVTLPFDRIDTTTTITKRTYVWPDSLDIDTIRYSLPPANTDTLVQVKKIYHNDFSYARAATLRNYFLSKNVPLSRFSITVVATRNREASEGDRATVTMTIF